MRSHVAAVLAVLLPSIALADDKISGIAIALDGDTILVFAGDCHPGSVAAVEAPCPGEPIRVRLFGIDAPEMSTRDGWYGRALLDALLKQGGDRVECHVVETDRRGRAVAHCKSAGRDLGAAMILHGWAVPFRAFTYRGNAPPWARFYYDHAERTSRTLRNGRWRFMPKIELPPAIEPEQP